MSEKRAHIVVSGRVQGVFYRDHTRRWASSLNIRGWVRNLSDGRVEVMAEGEELDLRSLLKLLQKGPPLAGVDDVEVEWEEGRAEFEDFTILWTA